MTSGLPFASMAQASPIAAAKYRSLLRNRSSVMPRSRMMRAAERL
ncbi:hypothetical protein STENM223S_11799 [Streptomyces tendae]